MVSQDVCAQKSYPVPGYDLQSAPVSPERRMLPPESFSLYSLIIHLSPPIPHSRTLIHLIIHSLAHSFIHSLLHICQVHSQWKWINLIIVSWLNIAVQLVHCICLVTQNYTSKYRTCTAIFQDILQLFDHHTSTANEWILSGGGLTVAFITSTVDGRILDFYLAVACCSWLLQTSHVKHSNNV